MFEERGNILNGIKANVSVSVVNVFHLNIYCIFITPYIYVHINIYMYLYTYISTFTYLPAHKQILKYVFHSLF